MARPITLPDPFRALAEKVGGVARLAMVLGVTPRTIHRWATGARALDGPARILVSSLLKKHGLAMGKEDQ